MRNIAAIFLILGFVFFVAVLVNLNEKEKIRNHEKTDTTPVSYAVPTRMLDSVTATGRIVVGTSNSFIVDSTGSLITNYTIIENEKDSIISRLRDSVRFLQERWDGARQRIEAIK